MLVQPIGQWRGCFDPCALLRSGHVFQPNTRHYRRVFSRFLYFFEDASV